MYEYTACVIDTPDSIRNLNFIFNIALDLTAKKKKGRIFFLKSLKKPAHGFKSLYTGGKILPQILLLKKIGKYLRQEIYADDLNNLKFRSCKVPQEFSPQ